MQITSLAIVTAVCACLVRPQISSLAMGVTVLGCVVILLIAVQFLEPIKNFLDRLRELSGLSAAATAPMIKVAAVGILSQISGSICEDAGETTLKNAIQIAGMALSLYLSLPLLSAVLELLEEML